MQTIKLSSKGQIVLPSATRSRHGWTVGTEFAVEETSEGVLLRPLQPFAPTRVEEVFGMAHYHGPQRSLEDMEQAITAEARRHK